MAPLSKELSGVVLRHDKFGTHLDSQGRTIDVELEKRNFAAAGEVLAKIWSDLVIDNHPVVAEFKNPPSVTTTSTDSVLGHKSPKNDQWYANHVRESQYFLQVITAGNNSRFVFQIN